MSEAITDGVTDADNGSSGGVLEEESLVDSSVSLYQSILDSGAPVTKGWPMVDSPVYSLAITLVYFLITWRAKSFMENRDAWWVKELMVAYNLGMVALNTYVLQELLGAGWLSHYSWTCQPLDSSSPGFDRMARACYLIYLTKLVELLDTLFFVLRKRFELMSFLHVFHHGVMPFNMWLGVKFTPGGSASFGPMLNVFVHIVMYTYYLGASLGPRYRKYLRWKPYVTILQIMQFVVVMVQCCVVISADCGFPKWIMVWQLLTSLVFFGLFLKFYADAYCKENTKLSDQGKIEEVKREEVKTVEVKDKED